MPDQSADLYPQMGSRDAPPTEEMDSGETDSQDAGGETALLPKSILAGKEFKPGEEVVLKIVRVMDDEVLVQYAQEKHSDEGESKYPSADEEIDSVATGGGYEKG